MAYAKIKHGLIRVSFEYDSRFRKNTWRYVVGYGGVDIDTFTFRVTSARKFVEQGTASHAANIVVKLFDKFPPEIMELLNGKQRIR